MTPEAIRRRERAVTAAREAVEATDEAFGCTPWVEVREALDKLLIVLDAEEDEEAQEERSAAPHKCPLAEDVLEAVIRERVRMVTRLLQEDPHSWSTRPCPTCRTITGIVGEPFGCNLYALQRKKQ